MCNHKFASVILDCPDQEIAKGLTESELVHLAGILVEPGYAGSFLVTNEGDGGPVVKQWQDRHGDALPPGFYNKHFGVIVFSKNEYMTSDRIRSAAANLKGIVVAVPREEWSKDQNAAINQAAERVACMVTNRLLSTIILAAYGVANTCKGPGIYQVAKL